MTTEYAATRTLAGPEVVVTGGKPLDGELRLALARVAVGRVLPEYLGLLAQVRLGAGDLYPQGVVV